MISNIGIKAGSNRNTDKTKLYHLKLPSTADHLEAHASPEIYLIKSSDKLINVCLRKRYKHTVATSI